MHPLKGFIVSEPTLSCPARFSLSHSPLHLVQTPAPTPLKISPLPSPFVLLTGHVFDELMHFLPKLADFVPSKTVFIVSAHRLPNITLLTLIATL